MTLCASLKECTDVQSSTSSARDQFSGNINNVLDAFDEIGDELYDELVEVLIMGDVARPSLRNLRESMPGQRSATGAHRRLSLK